MTFPMPPSPSGWCGQGNVWPSSHDLFHQPPIQLRHRPAVPGQQRPPADPALGRAAAGVRPRADLWCVPRGPGPHALPPPFLQVGSISGRLLGVGLCVLAFPGSLCFVAGALAWGRRALDGVFPSVCLPPSLILRAAVPRCGSLAVLRPGELPDSFPYLQHDGSQRLLATLAWEKKPNQGRQ